MMNAIRENARARCQWLPSLEAISTPRYQALVDQLAADIADGTLAPGDRLPPQRLLADALGVTVGTITRAYREAERRGLVEARVGSGTRVRERRSDAPRFHHLSHAADDSIDLSLSIPIPHVMRQQQLSGALASLSRHDPSVETALAYQSEQGNRHHRRQLADWLTTQGLPMEVDELLFTEGGQHADYLVLQALIHPGEAVASAALTYPGMIAAARQLGLKHIAVPMDDQGVRPDALERLCQQQRIRLLYVMPEHNNPTGCHMGPERRHALVDVARRHDMLLLEDGVQFVTAETRGTSFYQLAPDLSLYIFSTSKLLAGGLRFGALRAPAALIPKLCAALRAQCWAPPDLIAAVACQWLTSPEADSLMRWQWQEVAIRQQRVQEVLGAHQPKAHPCGFHAWLTLPDPWRATDFVSRAAEHGVTVISADPFCVGSQPAPQAVRLCVTPPADRTTLETGLSRLAELLEEEPLRVSPMV
ncbi:aminotransferase-like domain-containing protein [Aidingimonas lacisalsi]|uniref:aminotransferase-like domain-containing protein n=1 Tax=Aidingimonas lacisalsi TaxID=2604086 RepID=UPI001F3CB88C|nr:PLP-dependent aminotransferase family protein [Aidingimonas lacisalsi]